MTRPTDATPMYLAPGASGYASMVLPGARQSHLPPVDEHVVEPETRQEMIDGRIVHVAPASPPHGERHTDLDYVLRASVAPGYVCATDMLTRTAESWNFAADASIRKQGDDPATGHRYLEELAFEVKHTQRMKDITARARQLASRGVRRVFMICVATRRRGGKTMVQAGPVMEWSPAEDRWIELDPDTNIEDPCLRSPIRVRALLNATEADKAVARALLAKDNPVLVQVQKQAEARGEERGEARGYEQGRTETLHQAITALHQAITALCQVLDIELTPARRAVLDTLDVDGLRARLDHITAHRRWD